MIPPESVGRHRGLDLLRWRDPVLPPGVADLAARALAEGYAWMAPFHDEWATRPFLAEGEALFVATTEDAPVAMAMISADPHLADDISGRLRYIFVGRAARGHGLLRVFVSLCLSRAGDRWRRLTLHTENPIAAQVYESYGFVPTADLPRSTHVRTIQPAAAASLGA